MKKKLTAIIAVLFMMLTLSASGKADKLKVEYVKEIEHEYELRKNDDASFEQTYEELYKLAVEIAGPYIEQRRLSICTFRKAGEAAAEITNAFCEENLICYISNMLMAYSYLAEYDTIISYYPSKKSITDKTASAFTMLLVVKKDDVIQMAVFSFF